MNCNILHKNSVLNQVFLAAVAGMQQDYKKEICNKSGSNKINIIGNCSIHARTEANFVSIFPPSSSIAATVGAQKEDAYKKCC